MNEYYCEYTDTFAGEANYCWVNRFKISAKTMRQAITKFKREVYYSPLPRHELSDYGDMMRIDIGNTCAFFELWDSDIHNNYSVKEV